MTTHTKGPWHTTGGLVYAQINPGGKKLMICDAWRDVGAEVARANAVLIAAAPEILEALLLARDALTLARNNKEISTMQAIQTAILKATRQP